MQGIYVSARRPASKKAIGEAARDDPQTVSLEATSFIPGTEYNGPVTGAPNGTYYFVGPDPYMSRKFYGSVIVHGGTITVK